MEDVEDVEDVVEYEDEDNSEGVPHRRWGRRKKESLLFEAIWFIHILVYCAYLYVF